MNQPILPQSNYKQMHKMNRTSKQQRAFLKAEGLLNGTKKEILLAKRKYRREYKTAWARSHRTRGNEIRFHLSKDQFQSVKLACARDGESRPTILAKDLLLEYCRDPQIRITREDLLGIAREFGLVINKLYHDSQGDEICERLENLERLILQSIN